MTFHLPELSGAILTYLLVFSRVGAMVMLLPAIGEMGVPSRVRLVLALAIAFALTPQVQGNYPAVSPESTLKPAPRNSLRSNCAMLSRCLRRSGSFFMMASDCVTAATLAAGKLAEKTKGRAVCFR